MKAKKQQRNAQAQTSAKAQVSAKSKASVPSAPKPLTPAKRKQTDKQGRDASAVAKRSGKRPKAGTGALAKAAAGKSAVVSQKRSGKPDALTLAGPSGKLPAAATLRPAGRRVLKPTASAVKPTDESPKIQAAPVAVKVKKTVTKTTPTKAPAAAKRVVAKKPAVVVAVVKPETKTKPKAVKKTAVKAPSILLEGDVPPAPPVSGPGQRYALGPAAPPAHLMATEAGELPEAYGTKRLLLTARDPHWLFAYWDLTDEQQRTFNRSAKAGHLALRIYAQGAMAQPLSEVEVHPESRTWFVHVGKGGRSYVAQLGYWDRQHTWVAISDSQATLTPPDSLSEDTTVEFATVPVEVSFAKLIEVVKEAVQENVSLAQAIQQVAQEQIAAAGDGMRSEAAPLVTGAFPPPTGAIAPGHWTPEQEQALASMISMDQVRRVWVGSLEITELVRRRLARELGSLAAVPAGPGAVPPSSLGSLASPFGGGKGPSSRGFWFNVNAELVVYGATEPDATVTIGGREIKLRQDGSFSYRFSLPDGRYELPIVAVSVDRSEGRAADLHFQRQTEYQGDVGIHPQDPALEPPLPENVE